MLKYACREKKYRGWTLPEVSIREAFVQISVMLVKDFRVCATLTAPSGNIMGST